MDGSSYFHKVIVPVIHGCEYNSALTLATSVTSTENILLIGMICVPMLETMSAATLLARRLRTQLQAQARKLELRHRPQVLVTDQLWPELVSAVMEERPDLMVLEYPCQLDTLSINTAEAMQRIPCDVAIVRGPLVSQPGKVLVSLRGGPYAELSLRMALAIKKVCGSQVTSLHITPVESGPLQAAAYRGLFGVLAQLPEVDQKEVQTDDPAGVILDTSRDHDILVVGTTARPEPHLTPFGPVTERLLRESPAGVVVVKTARPMPADMASEAAGHHAISILVDKWFAENTYHANEFAGLKQLLELKNQQGLSISLALPALNEEETVGTVIRTIKSALMDNVPILDEIVLIDSNSTDQTRQIAESLGIPVYIHQQILPNYGARRGKGEALWKSLYVTRGDIVLWIDTDIVNIHPRFIYGLIGPLLSNPSIQFVKGFYRRPLRVGDKIQASGGGRVTELTARPLINLFYPQLSGVIQPLSGEYGGRRSVLTQLPFFSGYGVEIGLLIDVAEKFGLNAIAQVDLQERIHHNQPLEALSKMSFAIIQAVSRKLENSLDRNFLKDVNKTMKLVRYNSGRFFLDVEEIAELERQPMLEVPEYLEKLNQPTLMASR
jgi:nucleotide-binding universal stress UspA family protein